MVPMVPFLTCLMAGMLLLVPSNSSASSLGATRYVRDDGLVLLHAQRTGLPLVHAVIIVRSGAVVDPKPLGGLASLTASLLTEGTGSRSAEAFSEEAGFISGQTLCVNGGKSPW